MKFFTAIPTINIHAPAVRRPAARHQGPARPGPYLNSLRPRGVSRADLGRGVKLSIHRSSSLPPCRLFSVSSPFKSFLSYCSAPWSQLPSVKTHTAAAETYYGGLCMPPVARTQEESPMTAAAAAAATTISTTPGYSQYTSSAETNYGAVAGSPSHNHQHPLHFGEPISRASKTSPERAR